MAKQKPQLPWPGEREMLAAVVDNLSDSSFKLVYADWLEDQGDSRAGFLRAYVAAAGSMNPADFPPPRKLPREWLDLIGFTLLERVAAARLPELKERVLRLARPALRMQWHAAVRRKLDVGVSKVGGLPDLPPGFSWPVGDDCRATYNNDTAGRDELAGFLAQVNLAEIAHTHAARDLPGVGLLSFFCFQDIENDDPDTIGVMAAYFPDPASLVPTQPPGELTEGNKLMLLHRLTFEETLDLPEAWDGPWSKELKPDPDADYSEVLDYFREVSFENMLGYARSTSGGDPTPSKDSRHLILLENSVECRLHVQISRSDLAARNFDKIRLRWVDFD